MPQTQTDSAPRAADFESARVTVKPYLHRTPVFRSASISKMTGTDLYLKAENLQKTGSYKPRGALTTIAALGRHDRERGVITMSAGNLGQALAFAAAQFHCRCTVVIREDATQSKIDAIRGYGGDVVLAPVPHWREYLEEEQARRKQVFVNPFNSPDIVAGHGTLALELLEEVDNLTTVLVPVGGGALISGIAAAMKQRRPEVRIIGVEPEGAAVVQLSLQRGSPQRLDRMDTIADGLAAPWTEDYVLQIIRRHVDEMVLVSDAEIAHALITILERTKLLVEPSGAAGVAALLANKIQCPPGEKVVALLSGGNADATKLAEVFGKAR
jgi:threonine dehydratase